MTAREQQTVAASIATLLRPASVAVIGASRREHAPGHVVVRNLVQSGFSGPVYPVNPAAAEIRGLRAYPSVLDIPRQVDLAVVAVPASAVPTVVKDCAHKGVRAVVVLSSGFAEAGEDGRALQDEVLRAARRGDMRLVGPNCLGVANTDPGVSLNATFADTEIGPGRVGLMTQSGAVGIAALQRASELGIGLSAFISAGNKADVSGNDLLMYFEADERTAVVALYLESFGNPRKFSRLARHISATKPIVALVGGASTAGRRAAAGHTSSAVSSSSAVDALFGQCGVVRARSLEQFLHIVSVLAHQPLPSGRRIAVVSNGGGPAVLAADACAAAGLELAPLAPTTSAAIGRLKAGVAAPTNPVDLGADVSPAQLASAAQLVSGDPSVDALIVAHTPVPGLNDDDFAAALGGVADLLSGTTTLAVMLGQRGSRPPIGGAGSQVPVFGFPENAVAALAPIADYVDWRRTPRGEVPNLTGVHPQAARELIRAHLARAPEGCRLDADDSRRLLDCYGIPVVPTIGATGADAAVEAADLTGYPVVMKIADPDVVHKSDLGGVRLHLTGPEKVRDAYRQIADIQRGRHTGPADPHVLIQRQVAAGVELIVGVAQDEVFGPLLMFGLGGTTTELLADRVFRLTPLTDTDAATTVRSLRGSPLLFGYRNSPPVDVAAVCDLLLRVGRLADDLPQVAEIDLNPVIADEHGLAIVDAKVRLQPGHDLPSAVLPRLRPALTAA